MQPHPQSIQRAFSDIKDAIISQPIEPIKQYFKEIKSANSIDMFLPLTYQKILKKLGSNLSEFSIENSSIGEPKKYNYTLVKKDNKKRFLFLVPDSILLNSEAKVVIEELKFTFNESEYFKKNSGEENLKFYVFYKKEPLPVYDTVFDSFKAVNIDIKLNYINIIKDLKNYHDDVKLDRLEKLLDLKYVPPCKMCKELIRLQEILEDLPGVDDDRGFWGHLLKQADPRLIKILSKEKIQFNDVPTVAVPNIVNTLNRHGGEYGGLKRLLEVVSKIEDLPVNYREELEDMLKRYFI